MTTAARRLKRVTAAGGSVLALTLMLGLAASSGARAGEAEAKGLLKAMSDYLAAQKTISLTYDASFEVVTKDHQKLLLANSGAIDLSRPDKIRATRSGGFANVEMVFDGKTFTILGKEANVYVQTEAPGTLYQLVDDLRDKFHKPMPGADLLLPNVYDELMRDVVDVKDLGSGVIGGTECDHLAFRTKELDWQIWIAQGDRPYPCRYVITTTQVDQAPQYSIQITDWKTGDKVASDDFSFKAPADAKKIDVKELKDMKGMNELPSNFMTGDAQ
jgi:hypothetical protein